MKPFLMVGHLTFNTSWTKMTTSLYLSLRMSSIQKTLKISIVELDVLTR